MLVAKVVADKQYWILQEEDQKVGNIEAWDGGYQVRIHDQVKQFKTIRLAAREANITFEKKPVRSKPDNSMVHGFPVVGRSYNPVWDVTHRLPLYTKNRKSKSWFAAGWYSVKRGRKWRVSTGSKIDCTATLSISRPIYNKDEVTV
jgi:hypothetical protein